MPPRRLLLLLGAALCGPYAPLNATPVIELSGHGTTGAGGWDLTIFAQLGPSGASGFSRLVGGATGSIAEIVPPTDDPNSFWCINIVRSDILASDGDQRENIYIRDVGDGITSFDMFSFVSGIGIDSSFPTNDLFFLPIVQGDFVSNLEATGVPEGSSTIGTFIIALLSLEYCRRFVTRNKPSFARERTLEG